VLHFKLKIRQKSFAGHAPPGPASGAYSALQTASWTEGVASMEGVKGTGKDNPEKNPGYNPFKRDIANAALA